jgi:teichoic acid ribitol-phosphate primase
VSALVVRLRAIVVRGMFALARRLPLRRRVVLATAHDPALRGNLAVIRDALLAADPPIPVVVLAHASRGDWPGRIRAVWFAAVAAYHLATARLFVVDDYFFPIYVVRPRPGTTIVQTWHASGAFKKFGYSVLDKSFGATEALIRNVRIHGNYDICLVSSGAVAPFYAEAFGQPIERFRADIGIPRTDALFDTAAIARTRAAVRDLYGIAPDQRVVLYAPTFRGDSVLSAKAGPLLDLRLLRDRIGTDHVLLLRLHPFVRAGVSIPAELRSFAIDVGEHPEINDLLVASDVLVTDYSSVVFEYALLRRPMVFFAPDLADYEGERGFYFDYRTGVPGPVFDTTEQVATYLTGGAPDLERVDAFRAWAFDVADGHATERFVERIVRPALA